MIESDNDDQIAQLVDLTEKLYEASFKFTKKPNQ
jgi:hypothetical protein